MTERNEQEAADSADAFEGPAAPPAKGGGQNVEGLEPDLEVDDASLSSGGLDAGDEGASPPPPRGGGGGS